MKSNIRVTELRKEKKAVLAKEAKAGTLTQEKKTQIDTFFEDEEKTERSFDESDNWVRGPVMGRPKKKIKREVVAIRIPSDALKKIKAYGRGWNTRAGDALADLAQKGLL